MWEANFHNSTEQALHYNFLLNLKEKEIFWTERQHEFSNFICCEKKFIPFSILNNLL
jgi:hypothetical protein